jgi:hypothetical protein
MINGASSSATFLKLIPIFWASVFNRYVLEKLSICVSYLLTGMLGVNYCVVNQFVEGRNEQKTDVERGQVKTSRLLRLIFNCELFQVAPTERQERHILLKRLSYLVGKLILEP